MKILENQVAVVTGGGHGIGRAISQELGEAGAHVVVVGRRTGELEATADLIRSAGGSAEPAVTDVTSQEQVEAMVARVISNHSKIDLLVNNAGRFLSIAPVWESDPANWWQDLTVNVFGTFLCCRAVLPHMIQRRSGKVINMGGGGSTGPLTYGTAYGTSKAAIVRFGESLHEEVKEHGISVYTISPGLVRTEMTQHQVESPEGQRWLGRIARAFDEGRDVPPTLAGQLCVFLASPEGDRLGGRFVQATEDYRRIAERADEVIDRDLYTLRRTSLPS